MRKAIAAAMSRSKRDVPLYCLTATIDLSIAMVWVERLNAKRPASHPAGGAVPESVGARHGEWPQFNGAYENGAFTPQ